MTSTRADKEGVESFLAMLRIRRVEEMLASRYSEEEMRCDARCIHALGRKLLWDDSYCI